MPYLLEFVRKTKECRDARMFHIFVKDEALLLPWFDAITLKSVQESIFETVQLAPKQYRLSHLGRPLTGGRFVELGILPGACLKLVAP